MSARRHLTHLSSFPIFPLLVGTQSLRPRLVLYLTQRLQSFYFPQVFTDYHRWICLHLCHPWAISTCLSTHRHRVQHDSVQGDIQTTNATSSEKSTNGSEKSSEKSSEKIFNLIKQKPTITVLEIATEINMSPRGVEKQIRKLRETSIIKRVGADRGGYWEIINNDEK